MPPSASLADSRNSESRSFLYQKIYTPSIKLDIITANPEAPLPPSYTVFGRVTAGMDAALKIENVPTFMPGQVDRPIDPVVIESVSLK